MTTSVNTLSAAANAFIISFNGAIDTYTTSGVKFDVLKLIQSSKLRNADIVAVQTKFEKTAEELELAVIEADNQVIEGYSSYSKDQLRDMLTFYHTLLEVPTKKKTVKDSADKPARPQKEKATVVSENFSAVFTVCKKYNAVRVFIGNVVVTGVKVKADQIYQIRTPKNLDLSPVSTMSSANEILEYLKDGKKTDRTPTTLSGETIDYVVKFA